MADSRALRRKRAERTTLRKAADEIDAIRCGILAGYVTNEDADLTPGLITAASLLRAWALPEKEGNSHGQAAG